MVPASHIGSPPRVSPEMSEQPNKKQARKQSKRDNDEYAREMAIVRARQKRQAALRRRAALVVVLVVVVLGLGAGGWYWAAQADLASYAGPKNMLSDGVLLTASKSKVTAVSTAALAPKAKPVATDLSTRTSTENFAVYFDLGDARSARFFTGNTATLPSWLSQSYITLELHPLAVHDSASSSHWSLRSANAVACVAATTPAKSLSVVEALAKKVAAKGFTPLSDAALVKLVKAAGAGSATIASCIRSQSYAHWVGLATTRAEHEKIQNSSLKKLPGTPLVLIDKVRFTGDVTSAAALTDFIEKLYVSQQSASSSSGSSSSSSG